MLGYWMVRQVIIGQCLRAWVEERRMMRTSIVEGEAKEARNEQVGAPQGEPEGR